MNNLLKILLAIFLPPVCAFIQVGLSLHFFINIVLTLMGGLPGMVHRLGGGGASWGWAVMRH